MPQICIDAEVIAENGLCYVEQQAAIHGITVGCPEPIIPTPATSCLPTSQIFPDYVMSCFNVDNYPNGDCCEEEPFWSAPNAAKVCFNFDHPVRMFVDAQYEQCLGGSGLCKINRRFMLDGVLTMPNEIDWFCADRGLSAADQLESGHFVFWNLPAGQHELSWQFKRRNTGIFPNCDTVNPNPNCCGGYIRVWWYREEPCDGYVPNYYVGNCVA